MPIEKGNKRFHFAANHIASDWGSSEKWKSGLETFDWEAVPPRNQTDIYPTGKVIGPFLNVKDKPGGVEPGFVGYVRDEKYQEAVFQIILRHLTKEPLDEDSSIVKFFNPENFPGIDIKKILPAIKHFADPDYSIDENIMTEIHEIFRKIEQNCGSVLVYELAKLSPEQKLDKYLIKQDYKDPKLTDSVSISTRRAAMTAGAKEAGAEYGEWAQKARAKVHNLGRLQKKRDANKNGFMESMSTRLASASGMDTQVQGIVRATYKDPPKAKLLTMTKWQEGFSDFEDRLLGGDMRDGQFVVEMTKDENGKLVPKRDADGYFHSDKSLTGLGENLVAMLRQDDFDFFGSKGGNKGIVNNKFFGIDFGHAYERDNQIVGSLQENFSFTQPGKPVKNASALYDNPLSEKMKGIIILCKLRGVSVPDEIVKSYGKEFEEKYNKLKKDSDYAIFEEHLQKARDLEREDPIGYKGLAEEVEKRYKRAHEADKKILEVFKNRINLTAQQLDFIDNMEKLCSETTDLSPHGHQKNKKASTKKIQKLEAGLQKITARIEKLKKENSENFEIKIKTLRKKQTKLQKNLEKARNKELKQNAVVKLNHLRIYPQKSRVACQLTQVGDEYIISLNLPSDPKRIKIIQDRILKMDPNVVMDLSTFNKQNKLEIHCDGAKLDELMKTITEDNIKTLKGPKQPKINSLAANVNTMLGPDALTHSIIDRGLSFIAGARLILEHEYPKNQSSIQAQILLAKKPDFRNLDAIQKAWEEKKGPRTADDLKALIAALSEEIKEKIYKNDKNITVETIKDKELTNAENYANWKGLKDPEKRKTLEKRIQLSSKDENGQGKDIFQVRIDEPITHFTKEQEKEWLRITAPEENWPRWFKKLPQWEKNLLVKKVSDWDEGNSAIKRKNSNLSEGQNKEPLVNLGDYLGVPPTTVRGYPGARNAYKSYFYNYEQKDNGELVLVSQAFKIRSGHITPDKMKNKKERLTAAKENIKQLILAHAEQQIKNGNENLLFDLQTLITPPLKGEDRIMDKTRLDAISAIRKELKDDGFKKFLSENGVGVPNNKNITLTLVTSNYPVNIARSLVNVANVGMVFFFPLTAPLLYNSVKRIVENNRTTRVLNKIAKEMPEPQDNGFKMAQAALNKMNEISGFQRFKNFFTRGVNHNAERAALEQIAVSGLKGVRLGSCMSGKDREGGVSEHLAAMTAFYAKYEEFPPIPPTSGMSKEFKKKFPGMSDKDLRKEYEQMAATEFLTGYEQAIANANASGANGLKDIQHILGHNVMKAIKEIIVEKYFKNAPADVQKYWADCNIEKLTKKIASLNRVKEFSKNDTYDQLKSVVNQPLEQQEQHNMLQKRKPTESLKAAATPATRVEPNPEKPKKPEKPKA